MASESNKARPSSFLHLKMFSTSSATLHSSPPRCSSLMSVARRKRSGLLWQFVMDRRSRYHSWPFLSTWLFFYRKYRTANGKSKVAITPSPPGGVFLCKNLKKCPKTHKKAHFPCIYQKKVVPLPPWWVRLIADILKKASYALCFGFLESGKF